MVPFSILIRAYSFFLIINKDSHILSLKAAYRLTLIGVALNLFLPASSGDLAKVYFGYKSHGLKEELLSTSILDKLTSIIAVFALGSIAAYGFHLYRLSIFAIILTALFLIPVFAPKIVPWKLMNDVLNLVFNKTLDTEKLVDAFVLKNTLKLFVLAVSFFGWIVTYSGFFAACRMLNIKVSLLYILAISPIVTLARLFPLALGGLGSSEAVVAYLFHQVGVEPTVAITASLSSLVIYGILPGIAGYLIILYRKGDK